MVIAVPDLLSPSFFPVIAAVELGCCAAESVDARIAPVFPARRACQALGDGEVQYVATTAHVAPAVFDGWRGCRVLGAVSHGMPWLLVVAAGAPVRRGDLAAVRGRRIAAAPGPVDGLAAVLRAGGLDADTDVEIVAPPAHGEATTPFGVGAARALARGEVDGFWANAMGAELAVRDGTGQVLFDARRDAPDEIADLTFPVLLTSAEHERDAPGELAGMTRALMRAQRRLASDPSIARAAAAPWFPARERELIAGLIAQDTRRYDVAIRPEELAAVNRFAASLSAAVTDALPYETVVPSLARAQWSTGGA